MKKTLKFYKSSMKQQRKMKYIRQMPLTHSVNFDGGCGDNGSASSD
jgi:hypothetical protein